MIQVLTSSPEPSSLLRVDDSACYCNYAERRDEGFVVIDWIPVKPRLQSADADDDTASTASLSDCSSYIRRSVCFADDLVTEMYTRPYTETHELGDLYYTPIEIQQ
jgi:hypothetical protein